MGLYFKPGNQPFRKIVSKDTYVDRTGVIGEINRHMDKGDNLICLSLSPRNGKTWQLRSLYAYYDDSCDSDALFEGLAISNDVSFRKHLNQYLAIRLDMTVMMADTKKQEDIRSHVENSLKEEALRLFPEVPLSTKGSLISILSQIVEAKGKRLFFFIDEWDAPIRMAAENLRAQTAYLDMLRSWFKNESFTDTYVAGAYMTGILPLKKSKGDSALSDFKEYSVLRPGFFAPYIGFHEMEVRALCEGKVDFQKLEEWYEGYTAGEWHYYNPYAVIQAIDNRDVRSYWPAASAAESLMQYLELDMMGLIEAVASLIGGDRILVDTSGFQNDTLRLGSKEDVFTLLIYLGYLTYDWVAGEDLESWEEKENAPYDSSFVYVRIPNLELRKIFTDFLDQAQAKIPYRQQHIYGKAKDALDDAIDEALREAGILR